MAARAKALSFSRWVGPHRDFAICKPRNKTLDVTHRNYPKLAPGFRDDQGNTGWKDRSLARTTVRPAAKLLPASSSGRWSIALTGTSRTYRLPASVSSELLARLEDLPNPAAHRLEGADSFVRTAPPPRRQGRAQERGHQGDRQRDDCLRLGHCPTGAAKAGCLSHRNNPQANKGDWPTRQDTASPLALRVSRAVITNRTPL